MKRHPASVVGSKIPAEKAVDARALSRRVFVGLSLSAAGAMLIGCSSSSSGDGAGAAGAGGGGGAGGGAGVATDDVPFGIWEKLQTAVRASPDHLGATADRLVEAKDPKAIFEFVRDQIVTYPPTENDAAVTETRWGVRGTLRGGAGTPREKAELLANLYQRAGFDAAVVIGSLTIPDSTTSAEARAFLRLTPRVFAPAVDDDTLSRWTKEMAQTGQASSPTVPIDPNDTERSALVATIGAVLPSDLAAEAGSYPATLGTAALHQIPLVSVTVDGKTRYANPLFAEATFGVSLTQNDPVPGPDASPAPTVTVEILVSTTADPTNRISVAKGSYGADELAGRQILVQFAPAADVDTFAKLRIRDIRTFKPVLSVRGRDVDPDGQASFVVIGSEITTRGDVVTTASDGSVTVNGVHVFAPSQIDPNAAKSVASLTMDVRAGAFPTVRLVVSALDAGGQPVKGLAASAFRIAEGAGPLGFVETAIAGDKVRVLLIVDLDGPLASGDDPAIFAKQLTASILAAYPSAVIVTGGEGKYVERTDSAAVAAAVAMDDTDDCWVVLADAALQAPTLIVMVSDFIALSNPNDPEHPKASFRSVVALGPPVIAIGVAPSPAMPNPEVDALVALTGGMSLPSASAKQATDAVLTFLAKQKAGATYSLTYTAPEGAPAQRNVTLTVNAISAMGSYTVPAATQAVQAGALAGIYMTVTLGKESVTRVLGGYAGAPLAVGTVLSQAVLDDVRSALFGVTMLSFEAAAPTLSTWLDDVLAMKLALKPLWAALTAKDSKQIRATLPALRTYLPAQLIQLQCPLPAGTTTSATYETGLRVVAYSNQPRFGVGQVRRVDILPLAGWATISADPVVSFRDTLARTARVAIVEAHTFPKSTLSALAGKPLMLLPEGDVDPMTLPFAPEVRVAASEVLNQYGKFKRLLPTGGAFVGFWAVNTTTGALLGVLSDGTGGASVSPECMQVNDTNAAFDAFEKLAELGGMELGPFFFLGKHVAEIALLSSAILNGQDTEAGLGADAAINGLAASSACEAAKLAGGAAAGAAGGLAKAVFSGLSDGGSLDCPNALAGVGCK